MTRPTLIPLILLVTACVGPGSAEPPPSLFSSMTSWEELSPEELSSEELSEGPEDTSRQRRAIDDIYELDFWEWLPTEEPTASPLVWTVTRTVTQENGSTATLTETLTSSAAQTITETLDQTPATLSAAETLTQSDAPTATQTLTQSETMSATQTLTQTGTLTTTPTQAQTETLTTTQTPTPTPTPTPSPTQTLTQTQTQTQTGSLVDESDAGNKGGGAAAVKGLWSTVISLTLVALSGLLC